MLGYIKYQGESIATNGAFHVGTVKDPATGHFDLSKVRMFQTLDEAKAFIDAGKPAEDYDFIVSNHGSVHLVLPVSPAGRVWVKDHLPVDAQRFGESVAVEHRYIGDIVEGIQTEGLRVRA